MARNVEIKSSVRSISDFLERVSLIADSGPEVIEQDDTFFMCDNGRLKLRTFSDGSGEMIFYDRAGSEGPKTCHYEIVPIDMAGPLRSVLVQACGEAGRVRKRRTLYMVGRTRVHIDEVEGLGTFVELEVVLDEGESVEVGVQEANELMAVLGIEECDLIDRPYVDLLNDKDS
jgi:adenylate cyclase class IV